MSDLPIRPIIQLSNKAMSELKTVLQKEIGKDALKKLSEKEINHIGCLLLSLTAIQLKMRIKERQKQR